MVCMSVEKASALMRAHAGTSAYWHGRMETVRGGFIKADMLSESVKYRFYNVKIGPLIKLCAEFLILAKLLRLILSLA